MSPLRSLPWLALLASSLLSGCSCNDGDGDDTSGTTPTADGLDRGQWLSMGTLPGGTPVAAFYNRTRGGLEFGVAQVAEDGTVTWSYEPVDGFPDETGLDTGDRGLYASMAVSPDGTVWVAYQDVNNKSLRYARRTVDLSGGAGPSHVTWETGVADTGGGSSPNAGLWASLALDPAGNPVVAHYDAGKGQLRVVRWQGEGFGGVTVISGEDYVAQDTADESRTADVGAHARLSIADDGTEYVLFYDAAWGALRLATGGAQGYTVGTVDDDGDVGQWPSMHIGGDGTLRIAYQDVGSQDLKYAQGTPGSFTIETVDRSDYAGADTELFMNGDFPSILYFSGLENDLYLARRAGGSWTTERLAGEDAALGFHNEVVANAGTNWVGCYDYTHRTIWFRPVE